MAALARPHAAVGARRGRTGLLPADRRAGRLARHLAPRMAVVIAPRSVAARSACRLLGSRQLRAAGAAQRARGAAATGPGGAHLPQAVGRHGQRGSRRSGPRSCRSARIPAPAGPDPARSRVPGNRAGVVDRDRPAAPAPALDDAQLAGRNGCRRRNRCRIRDARNTGLRHAARVRCAGGPGRRADYPQRVAKCRCGKGRPGPAARAVDGAARRRGSAPGRVLGSR